MSIIGNAILQLQLNLQARRLKKAKERGDTALETKLEERYARRKPTQNAYIEFQKRLENALSAHSRDKKEVEMDSDKNKVKHKAGVEIKMIQSLGYAVSLPVKKLKEDIKNYKNDKEPVSIICDIINQAKEIKDVTNKSTKARVTKGIKGDIKEAQRIKPGLYLVEFVDENNKNATALVHYSKSGVEVWATIYSVIGRKRIQAAVKNVKERNERFDKYKANPNLAQLYSVLQGKTRK
ncbi:MAG: hypothetical protein MJ165_04325 [Alphaproteobacteria bacterium]|nr:hypothetical protein [Alphaproteobacteria bacterium]